MGLKVVMDSGLPVTLAASPTCNLLRAADFLPFGYGLAIVSAAGPPDGKRLGDLAAATSIVPALARAGAESRPDRRAAGGSGAAALARRSGRIIALAARAPRLTPERLDELASLAAAVSGDTGHSGPPSRAGCSGSPSGRWPPMTTPLQFEQLYERDWPNPSCSSTRSARRQGQGVSAAQVSRQSGIPLPAHLRAPALARARAYPPTSSIGSMRLTADAHR